MRKIFNYCLSVFKSLGEDNITVYSAYASFYMVISFVPFLMMLFMIMGQFITISAADFGDFVNNNVPKSVAEFLLHIIDEILRSDAVSMISIPVITLLWTASRSVVAVEKGLDSVYRTDTKRSFIKLNIYALFYTFTFLIAILFALIIIVFGNFIGNALSELFPFAVEIINTILSARSIVSLVILTLFFTCVYKFFPGRKLRFLQQLPGAVFSASGWMIFSLIFSVYVDNFANKSYVYGSLTALIVFMLWVYFCMIIMFLGGKINFILLCEKGIVDKIS